MCKHLRTAQDMKLAAIGQGWSVVANNPAMTSVANTQATATRFV